MCCIIIFCAFGVLYANTTTLPGMLQSLFGYDATTSGLVLSPAGVFAVIMLFIVGSAPHPRRGCALSDGGRSAHHGGRQFLDVADEPRHRPLASRLAAGRGHRWPFDDVRTLERCRVYCTFRRNSAAAAVGLLALLRNEGGSVGTTVGKIILDRREQFHTLRLNESLDPFNPELGPFFAQGHNFFMQQTGDPAASQQMSLHALEQVRDQQALSLAYFDVFWSLAGLAVLLIFLVPLMRRAVAEKGAHIAAE